MSSLSHPLVNFASRVMFHRLGRNTVKCAAACFACETEAANTIVSYRRSIFDTMTDSYWTQTAE